VESCLVIANATLLSTRLRSFARELAAREPCTFHLLVLASTPSTEELRRLQVEGVIVRPGEAPGLIFARHRLRIALAEWTAEGLAAEGEIGGPELLTAVEHATSERTFGLILMCTLPRHSSSWLQQDLPARLLRATEVPILHLEATAEHMPIALPDAMPL
jgi:hypothetical protein